jgi:DNA-binding transcriptional ArsR family regulator
MKTTVRLLKLLSDPTRLRILMVLTKRELCVCQIMGVLGISQPLVSRNLTLLNDAGLLEERREGKLVFYALRKGFPAPQGRIVALLKDLLKSDKIFLSDLKSLRDCEEFQKRTGKCDMRTLSHFMERKKRRSRKP